MIYTLRTRRFRAFPVVTADREFLGVIKRKTILRHLTCVFKYKCLSDQLSCLLPRDFSGPPEPREGW